MAEDQDEKTEEPSAKRMDEARKKGNLAVSQDLKHAFALAGVLALVSSIFPAILPSLFMSLRVYIAAPHSIAADGAGIGYALLETFGKVALLLALPVLAMMICALAGTLLQTGIYFSAEAFKFDFNRLNPLTGLKRLFSMRSLVELVKSVLKLTVIGTVATLFVIPIFRSNQHYALLTIPSLLVETQHLMVQLITAVCVAAAVIGGADYLYQRFQHIKGLRMTKQEIKDEYKQAEGDPHIKSRVKRLRQQKARQRMMAMVPKSDVVITNPTHYAIALEYKPDSMNAPVVRAKGADAIAKRIREIASEHNIPFVSNPPLARALFASTEVDDEIPAEHYKAVAEVISYIFKLKGRANKRTTN